jgi:hypothetical protein
MSCPCQISFHSHFWARIPPEIAVSLAENMLTVFKRIQTLSDKVTQCRADLEDMRYLVRKYHIRTVPIKGTKRRDLST